MVWGSCRRRGRALGRRGLLRTRLLWGVHLGVLEELVQNLGKGGVGVDVELEVLDGLVGGHRVRGLVDEVGGVQADDPNPQDLPGVLPEDGLGHAVPLQLREGLGVGLERRLHHTNLELLLLRLLPRLLFRQSDEAHLRVREARRWDRVVVQNMGPPLDVLDRRDALRGRGVSEHVLPVGVPDAVHVRHRLAVLSKHLHLVCHRHEAPPVRLRPNLVKGEPLGEGHPAGGHQAGVDLHDVHDLLGVEVRELDLHGLHPGHPLLHVGGQHPGPEVDVPRGDQGALRKSGDLVVEPGHDLVDGLDEGDLAA
mmetsp:Transcript_6980/g.25208  ORF Transcript_6980/g.25208 Transcript_6980/m.25208 type:complete len:309 (-) Transcript_6980:896-1822(-)